MARILTERSVNVRLFLNDTEWVALLRSLQNPGVIPPEGDREVLNNIRMNLESVTR